MIDKEEFQNLSPSDQARVFRESNLDDKRNLLLYSHEPEKLTQAMSLEELFLITRETDLEERSEIIRFAALPQLLFVADLDCWVKDRISPSGFVGWLETLQKADEQRLLAWLIFADYETVVSGFKAIVSVVKPDWEYARDEVLADYAYFTIDEQYYIYVKEENYETVRRAVELLFEKHRGRYAALLEGLMAEVDDTIEEEAYQHRANRLADRGFPEQETARRIYRAMSEEEFFKFPKKEIKAFDPNKDEKKASLPNYLTLWTGERSFLDDTLLLFKEEPPEVLEHIYEELAWLSNKVIASDGIDFSSEQKVRSGIERARCLVSIGLEILCGEDLAESKKILKERWLENIFRLAVADIHKARDRAFDIVKKYWDQSPVDFLEFLGHPYDGIFRGLLQNFAQYSDLSEKKDSFEARDFKNLNELHLAARAVSQIEVIHALLAKKAPALIKRVKSEFKGPESDVTLISVLGTVFAMFVLNAKIRANPLEENETAGFLKEAFHVRGERLYLNPGPKEKFLRWFIPEKQIETLRPLWGVVFQELEDELGGLKDHAEKDFRFVSSVWVAKNGRLEKTKAKPRR